MICEVGPLQEIFLITKKKMNNLPFPKSLGKTHTYNELFTKAEPKNEREKYRKMKRAEDWAERESEEKDLISLSLNKRVLITVTYRFPLLMS